MTPSITAPTKPPYLLLLVIAVFAVYVNCLNNAFIFDDQLLITLNEYLRQWATTGKLLMGSTISGAHVEGGFYRPIQMFLYLIIYQVTGPITIGFHLLNITLHAVNACLVFTLGRRMRFNDWASFCAALIWAVHPIHTEAVTYMSATADPLFAMFCMLAIINLLPDFAPRRFYYAAGLMLLGLLSKEVTVMLPFLATATIYAAHPDRTNWRVYLRAWPLWTITIAYTLWRMTTPGLDGPQSYDRFYQNHDYSSLALYADHLSYRIYTCLATLPAYAGLLLWPAGLHMERKFDVFAGFYSWLVVGGMVMCAASAAVIWQFAKKNNEAYRPLAWGLLWFGAAHLPDTGIAIPVNAFFLEHWMYLPSVGLFLGIAETAHSLIAPKLASPIIRRAIIAVIIGVTLALSTATIMQNRIWNNAIAFYTHMFQYPVASARGHNNLAIAYMDKDELDKAVEEYKKAIETSDTYPETRHNLAICLLKYPDQAAHWDEAISNLKRAIELDPNFYRSYGLLGLMYHFKGQDDIAIPYANKSMELKARLNK